MKPKRVFLTRHIWFLILLLLLLLSATGSALAAGNYPAKCRVTVDLNVRSKPSKNGSKIGLLHKNDYIIVNHIEGTSSNPWGAIDYGSRKGYVSMRYVNYIGSMQQAEEQAYDADDGEYEQSDKGSSFLGKVGRIAKWVFIILCIVLVLALLEFIIEIAVTAAIYAGIGAIVFSIFGGSASTGATVGLVIAALVCLQMVAERLNDFFGDIDGGTLLRGIFIGAYYVISFPIYFLNRLEHFLVAPWRYFFMKNWASDSAKPALRVITEIITVLLYIVTTPLRLANAIIYNIFIHCITGIYDLLLEVLAPSDDREGGANVWTWIYMLPYRVGYYAIWHVFLLLLESMIWTVADIFIPALTFYHGTTQNAGNAITCDPQRNRYLKNTSQWSTGNFLSSSDPNRSWAGKGVYFAIQRGLAMAYSEDDRSGRGGDPVMIVCRVSIGRVISYALMPDHIYNQAGGGGRHERLNEFADAHGYTTGEWYNPRGVWEYCLFDWKNGYNHPWRIRPIYMFNLRTGMAQHISGGMQHWLFDKAVMEDLAEYLE